MAFMPVPTASAWIAYNDHAVGGIDSGVFRRVHPPRRRWSEGENPVAADIQLSSGTQMLRANIDRSSTTT